MAAANLQPLWENGYPRCALELAACFWRGVLGQLRPEIVKISKTRYPVDRNAAPFK